MANEGHIMAAVDDSGGNSVALDGWEAHPFTWILVPVCVLVTVALVVTWLRYKRRNKRDAYNGSRDLEALDTERARRQANGRWQWAGDGPQRPSGRRRLGLGMVNSREEGLNELGEAPPAYTPSHKRSTTEESELGDMSTPSAQVFSPHLVPETTSTGSEPGSETVPAMIGNPPGYDDVTRQRPLAPPPAAVIGSS